MGRVAHRHLTSNYCSHLDCLLSSCKVTEEGPPLLLPRQCVRPGGEPLCPPATHPITVFPVREEDGHIDGIDEKLAEAAMKRRTAGSRRLSAPRT
jgi:3-phenylpropionate/trans-cinnamate dioxygenase ferredoxin component